MRKIFWILLILPYYLIAQEQSLDSVNVNLSNPSATLNTHLYFLQEDSYQPKKAAKTILGLEEKKAIKKAIKIKQVLDGKGLFVDFNNVPVNANYKDSIGNSAYSKYIMFPNRLPEIYLEKTNGKWYYSAETVSKIDGIYNNVYPWYVSWIQDIVPEYGHKKILGIEIWQLVALVLLLIIVMFAYVLVKKIAFALLQRLQKYVTKSNSNLEINKVIKKLAHPISLLVCIKIIDVTFPSLQFS